MWKQAPYIIIRWNVQFWITFNFWWSARLVNGPEPHLAPLSSQKNEMLIFRLCSTSDEWPDWSMDSNPIHHPSPAKKENACFWITINFWWSAQTPSATPLQTKNEMLIFGLRSTSDDQSSDPRDKQWLKCKKRPLSHHKMKCLFLDYVQLLIIGWVIWAMKVNWNVTKGSLSHRTLKCLVLDYVQFLMISWTIGAIKFEWNVKAGPLYYHKMKCSILDYVQLLMIGQAGQWTWTPSGTPLQPKK